MTNLLFSRLILFTTGYTEDMGHRTGLEIAHAMTHLQFGEKATNIPHPFRWKDDPRKLVSWIVRNCTHDCRVDVIGYSYGGGVWFPKFEKALWRKARRSVDTLTLIDPVPRFAPFGFSLFGPVKARYCENVTVILQKQDIPRSPGVRCLRATPNVHMVNVGHASVDEPLRGGDLTQTGKLITRQLENLP
jgi:pimeloyl-ACP methyl ester carboxylesterase